MKFTIPCFVRVEDADELKELMDWLSQLGYEICYWDWDGYIRIIRCWTTPKGIGRAVGYSCKQVRRTDVDCGDNIELFKALAAMNDENDREQWFTCELNKESIWWKCNQSDRRERYMKGCLLHKATAEEIVGHFKNRKR